MFTRLESLRGLAAIMVVLYHSPFHIQQPSPSLISHSYLFVDLFFVLSGFVMAYAYGDKIRGGMGFGHYLVLRLGRLYPLHLFTLLLWVPYILLKQYLYQTGFGGTDQLDQNNTFTFVTNLLLLQGMGVNDSLSWNHPSWSISTEFFAYIVFFVTAITIDRAQRIWVPLALSAVLYAVIFLVIQPHGLDITYDHGFIRCIAAFYLGVFIFRLRAHGTLDSVSVRLLSVVEIITLAAVVATVSAAGSGYPMIITAILSFGALVFVFATKNGGTVSRILDLSLVRKIGVWSFSIYMTHRLIQFGASNVFEFILEIDPKMPMGWTSVPLNLILLVGIIWFSRYTYEWVEKPCRDRVKKKTMYPQIGGATPG